MTESAALLTSDKARANGQLAVQVERGAMPWTSSNAYQPAAFRASRANEAVMPPVGIFVWEEWNP